MRTQSKIFSVRAVARSMEDLRLFRQGEQFSLLVKLGLGILLLGVGAALAFASETRVIGTNNAYLIRGSKHRSKKKPGSNAVGAHKAQEQQESANTGTKGQTQPVIKPKSEALNTALLDEEVPEITRLTASIKANPEDAESHFALAVCYHQHRVLDRAQEEYQRAIELNSGNATYHEAMAKLWKDEAVFESSRKELEKALQLAPDSIFAWNLLGTIYDDQGDLTQALRCYRKALSLKQDLDYVHSNLCFIYLRTGELQNAILHGEEAIRLNPDSRVAHNNLGIAYALAGNKDLALEEFEHGGDLASAHNNLGLVLLGLKKADEAMEQFRIAIRLKPFYRLAAENYRLARSLKTELEKQNNRQMGRGEPKGG
ncbi:MAG TPA: tetratricopeptide repeat protein [Terriglobia bacterium]|nr:tetratricopeptide repeat protein [Terriglobia bacterium]